jgi:hypothetical protein
MKKWRKDHGLVEPKMDLSTVPADLPEAYVTARMFEDTPDMSDDPETQRVFNVFKQQSEEMWEFMTRPESEGGLGITVDWWEATDPEQFGVGPYPTAAAQAEDLRQNHHIFLESGLGGEHDATMTREQYDRFRAVHDVFGHAGIGGGFDRHGEYQAYLAHASMYADDGERGMASEYHGVNTAMWTGAAGTPGTGKSVLLPEPLTRPPWDPETGEPRPLPDLTELAQFVDPAEIPGTAPVRAAADLPGKMQLERLRIDKDHAESLGYLAEQVGFTDEFVHQYETVEIHSR